MTSSTLDVLTTVMAMTAYGTRRAHQAGFDGNPQAAMIPLQALVLRYLSRSGLSIREVDRRSKGELDKSTLSNIARGLVYQRPTRQVEVALRRWLKIPKPELDDALAYWAHRAEVIQLYDQMTDDDREQVDHLVKHLAGRTEPVGREP